jgi:hypothetical protein
VVIRLLLLLLLVILLLLLLALLPALGVVQLVLKPAAPAQNVRVVGIVEALICSSSGIPCAQTIAEGERTSQATVVAPKR